MYTTYIQDILQCGVLGVRHQQSEISMSVTYDVGLDGESIGFYIELNLVKGIIGGNAEDSDEIRFGIEVIVVVYRGDTCVGVRVIILSYIYNG